MASGNLGASIPPKVVVGSPDVGLLGLASGFIVRLYDGLPFDFGDLFVCEELGGAFRTL